MNPTMYRRRTRRIRAALLTAGFLAGGGALAACASSSTSTPITSIPSTPAGIATVAAPVAADGSTNGTTAGSTAGSATVVANATTTANSTTSVGGPVLPVAANPIANTSTVQALKIDSVLVENNVDGAGKVTSDHLEIALTNTGGTELKSFEVFYTFTDPASNVSENYYVALPADFTIPAGQVRIAHFDNTGEPDHFPVNEFSLYYSDTNALDVSVTVSAADAAVQTTNLHKDAGGPETAD
jgi:hypothetical protein